MADGVTGWARLRLSGVFGAALAALARLGGGTVTFADAALSTFHIFMVFNLVDLVIIDLLLVGAWRPRVLSLPGLDGVADTGDFAWHFHAFLKGTVGGAFLALLLAALAVVIW